MVTLSRVYIISRRFCLWPYFIVLNGEEPLNRLRHRRLSCVEDRQQLPMVGFTGASANADVAPRSAIGAVGAITFRTSSAVTF